ncbi:hypothetical protein CEUSTIGMA_g9853.t1 [Chlamydomonas eustigma]|uniref:Uncharacterized protein n=1 Tax=Chlamydomonas eustigma TaxID=1157962 RepID=A0A250XH67_9CHLO|nr:hypothetical protein CEUSTIGMA_g9853.t1 [Chlamydomonas eustigma]|eukprot:GAX82425.1 hypothetical protein CEUSTIGMA_g9853.t1 [Chlamydomonas eustigma]
MSRPQSVQRWLIQATFYEHPILLMKHRSSNSGLFAFFSVSRLRFGFACFSLLLFACLWFGRTGLNRLHEEMNSRTLPTKSERVSQKTSLSHLQKNAHGPVDTTKESVEIKSVQQQAISQFQASRDLAPYMQQRSISESPIQVTASKPMIASKPRTPLPDRIGDKINHSKSSWMTLSEMSEASSSQERREVAEQSAISSFLTTDNSLSSLEAKSVLELLLDHMLTTQGPQPAELQQTEAKTVISALQKIWHAHHRFSKEASSSEISDSHCTTEAGQKLLLSLAAAVSNLKDASCGRGLLVRSGGTGLPYVALRRITLAMLHLINSLGGEQSCSGAVLQIMPSVLTSYAECLNCSRPARVAFELIHISKSGGTSMCQLAASSKLYNPGTTVDANCLVPRMYDEPKWTRLRPGQDERRIWPAVSCPNWLSSPQVGCKARAQMLMASGITFLSNEVGLHEGDESAGSAQACPQLETVVVLRDAIERSRSHISEVIKVFSRFRLYGGQYSMPKDVDQWKTIAPAIIDNYMIRSLLGRHFLHCRDFGTIGEPELLAASFALTSIDHVLVLGYDDLNDVAMRAGMGWSAGLRSKRWRWSGKDIEDDLGFPPGSMAKLEEWNLFDRLLHVWGKSLLKLDVVFHAEVAAAKGKLSVSSIAVDVNAAQAAPAVDLKTANEISSSRTRQTTRSGGGRVKASATTGLKALYNSGYIHMDDNRKPLAGDGIIMPPHLVPNQFLTSLMNGRDVASELSNITDPSKLADATQVSVLLFNLPLYASMPISKKWRGQTGGLEVHFRTQANRAQTAFAASGNAVVHTNSIQVNKAGLLM